MPGIVPRGRPPRPLSFPAQRLFLCRRNATTTYAAVIAISGAEKGNGLKPGDVVEVRYVSQPGLEALEARTKFSART